MAIQQQIQLDPQRRGDPFDYSSSLTGGYVASMIDEMWFTLREQIPASTTTDDTDAVAQGTLGAGIARGTLEITFSDTTNFRVLIPGTRTQTWPMRRMFWDCQVRVAGVDYTTASGTVTIQGDITRSR